PLMARIGLGSCLGVLAFLTVSRAPAAEPAVPPSQAIAATLAVQEAMRQGRELLHANRAEEAGEVLEAQLTRINGNPAYLALLRDAYTAYVKALQLSHQDERCAVYQKRLQILEHNARAETPPAPVRAPDSPGTSQPPATDKVARAIRAEDDPFQQTPRR